MLDSEVDRRLSSLTALRGDARGSHEEGYSGRERRGAVVGPIGRILAPSST